VLAGVLQVRDDQLQVLLWERNQEPHAHRWSLPGGLLGAGEDVESSIRRQLAEKVDVRKLSHVEQLAVFSDPHRVPGTRILATAFLGLVPSDADPEVPADTRWHPVDQLPNTAFDHGRIINAARERLQAKLSYTNLGFALAPAEFTISELRRLYSAALGYEVSATNLQRVLSRRGVLQPTGRTASSGPAGGRPASLYRFTSRDLQITDPFAVFRPPTADR
jgi:ADP-ribose pyrophosphatase YjhB (NUDIX family)